MDRSEIIAKAAKTLKGRFGVVLFVLTIIGLAVWTIPDPREEIYRPDGEITAPSAVPTPTFRFEAELFLINQSLTRLIVEKKRLEAGKKPEDKIRAAVEALIADERFTLLPPETVVRELFVVDKVAYLSLDSSFLQKFQGGILDEALAVMSLVNTAVAAAANEVERVAILIDDRERDFFASHIVISRPLAPDMSLVTTAAKNGQGERAPNDPDSNSPSREKKS